MCDIPEEGIFVGLGVWYEEVVIRRQFCLLFVVLGSKLRQPSSKLNLQPEVKVLMVLMTYK